jgi:hypothetical protein
MDQNLVFFRTEKGRQEIATRSHHLPHRLRAALILVNDVSSVRELQHKAGGLFKLDEMLEQLALEGYIAVRDERWAPAGAEEAAASPSPREMKARLIDLAVLTFGKDATLLVNRLKDAPDDAQTLQQVVADCRKQLRLIASDRQIRHLQEKCQQLFSASPSTPAEAAQPNGSERLMTTLKEELIRATATVLGDTATRVAARLEQAPAELNALRHAAHQCESLVRLTLSVQKADELKKAYADRLAALAQYLAPDANNVAPLRRKI